MHMQDLDSFRAYVRKFCDNSKHWQECTFAKELMQYYDSIGGRDDRPPWE